jgi:hypothetical protein
VTILNIAGGALSLQFTTSGSFAFSVARDDIIRQAMLNLALLEPSEIPTAQEIVDCARVLNMIVKQLAGQLDRAPGFKMWQRHRGDLFLDSTKYLYNLGSPTGDNFAGGVTGLAFPALYQQNQLTQAVAAGGTVLPVASTAAVNIGDAIGILVGSNIYWTKVASYIANTSITIPAPGLSGAASASNYVWNYTKKAQRPMKVLTALLRQIDGTDTPLTEMTLEVYEALATKTQPGFVQDPTAWYYEARMENNLGHLYIDCAGAQDVTKHLHLVFLREAMDFVNPGDAPEFPQEWFWHLSWTLSLGIHTMFDADWTQGHQETYLLATTNAREGNPQTTQAFFQPEDEDNY